MATSPHLFHLSSQTPQIQREGGWRKQCTSQDLPILKKISLALLQLNPLAVREPHWHPNAHELLYCLKGKALMTIFTPDDDHETFTIDQGDMVFVPKNYIHHLENVGSEEAHFAIAFAHENPEDLQLSSSVGAMSNHVLGSTFAVSENFFNGKRHLIDPVYISMRESPAFLPVPSVPNRFKLELEGVNAQIRSSGGWAKKGNKDTLPLLEGIGLFSLVLEKDGIREPHWHPNAHELNYVIEGHCRVTILSPDNTVDTFEMHPGDMSFMPSGYIHDIENLSDTPMRMLVYFTHESPNDIGISGSFGAYSNEVLASVLGGSPADFSQLPKYQHDLIVVKGD